MSDMLKQTISAEVRSIPDGGVTVIDSAFRCVSREGYHLRVEGFKGLLAANTAIEKLVRIARKRMRR